MGLYRPAVWYLHLGNWNVVLELSVFALATWLVKQDSVHSWAIALLRLKFVYLTPASMHVCAFALGHLCYARKTLGNTISRKRVIS